jgi:predicted transcriptional regulator
MAKTKRSQRDIVLSWLKKHGEITTRQAVTELNIMSLPKRIEELRNSGIAISTTYRTAPSGSRYGVYKLITE